MLNVATCAKDANKPCPDAQSVQDPRSYHVLTASLSKLIQLIHTETKKKQPLHNTMLECNVFMAESNTWGLRGHVRMEAIASGGAGGRKISLYSRHNLSNVNPWDTRVQWMTGKNRKKLKMCVALWWWGWLTVRRKLYSWRENCLLPAEMSATRWRDVDAAAFQCGVTADLD